MFSAITLGAAIIITWIVWGLKLKWFVFVIVGINVVIFLTWLYADDEGEKLVKYKNKNKEQRRKILLDFLVRMQTLLMFINLINIGISSFISFFLYL